MKRIWLKLLSGSHSLRVALVAGVVIFAFCLGVFIWGAGQLTSRQASETVRKLDNGIRADKQYLLDQGNAVASDAHFVDVVVRGNPDEMLSLIVSERDRRGIGLMGFADKNGIVISRTRTSSSTGENAFLVSPQGRALARGATQVASVEVSSFDPVQIFMTTGRHVFKDEERVGALFSNRLMDDEYARGFRDKYLPTNSEVFFYTKGYGVYGASVSDEEVRSIALSYFNADSDWIHSAKSDTMIRLGWHTYYQVKNIAFTGIEGDTPGGALVLVPYYGYSFIARALFAIVGLAVFVYVSLKSRPPMRVRNRYYYWTFFSFFFLLGLILLILSRIAFIPYSQFRKIPYVLYNSTMRLQPEAGVFDTSFERPVTILLNTGSEHINAVNVVLSYNPKIMEVLNIDTEDSLCSLFMEKTIDTVRSQIKIVCGLPTPGFYGSSGEVATIIFKPLKAGSSNIRFTSETMVLANDGLGTNVLRMATDGNYRFMDNIDLVQFGLGHEPANDTNLTPVVYSSTHPNGGRWYSSRDVRFFWRSVATTTDFMYSFDRNASTTALESEGTFMNGMETLIHAPSDGVFYLHVAPVVGGKVGPMRDYKVMIDTTAPSNVVIKSSADQAIVGDIVRLEFEGEDSGGGLQNTMYVDIDNSGLFLPVGRQTYIPFSDPGLIPVTLRVYDKAGNFTQVEKNIDVSGKPGQWLMRLTH